MCAGGGTQLSASSCHCPALRGVLHVTIKAQVVFVVSSCKRHCNIKHSNIYKNVYKNQQGVAEPKKLCASSLFVSLQELAALQTVSGSVSTTCGTHSCTVLHISIKKKTTKKQKDPVHKAGHPAVQSDRPQENRLTANTLPYYRPGGKKKLAVGIHTHNSALITCTPNTTPWKEICRSPSG